MDESDAARCWLAEALVEVAADPAELLLSGSPNPSSDGNAQRSQRR